MQTLTLPTFINRFQLHLPPPAAKAANHRHAAVLLPIICRVDPTLLLTCRARHLRQHAGQVAFPGGAAEPTDRSLTATALREAEEEITLPAKQVQILGQLSPLDSVSGFQVTPVIGLLPPDLSLIPHSGEVDELFEIPLSDALTLSHHHVLQVHSHSRSYQIYLSCHSKHLIWGLTASIIHRLAQQISL